MRFMVLSDNHGNRDRVQQIITANKDQMDYIFHCGDSEFDPKDTIWDEVTSVVRGNMDHYSVYPTSDIIQTEVGTVYMTHGHLSNIKYSVENIINEGKQHQADFIFYGHSHRLDVQMRDNILLLNPGSLNDSRGEYPYLTYAVLNITKDNIEVDFYTETMDKISALSQSFMRKEA